MGTFPHWEHVHLVQTILELIYSRLEGESSNECTTRRARALKVAFLNEGFYYL